MKPLTRHCAIYTRKSTEEGLDQDFNTLDAQREACLAYIMSQKSEGWIPVKDAYDDGGFSGGTIVRPALQQLMSDIKAGKVNIVVVYKIDRLTRSLTDFSKLVEIFDQYGVTFVSVTQSFNTTTSMGRLTLNVLLSFSQFEREVIGERTRDKILASKQKGMWMGGVPPLGYDIINRSLVVNPDEAKSIQTIFDEYLRLGCVIKLKPLLENRGIKSKLRISKKGHVHTGGAFSRGALYFILGNPIYIGMVRHKTKCYLGQHEAIISKEKWELTQQLLAANAAAPRGSSQTSQKSILKGKLFDTEDRPYGPVYTSKRGKHYRYYLNQYINESPYDLKKEIARFPAHELETLIAGTLEMHLFDKAKLAKLLHLDDEEHFQLLQRVVSNFVVIGPSEVIAEAVSKVTVDIGKLHILISACELNRWIAWKFNISFPIPPVELQIQLDVPFKRKRVNKGAWILNPANPKASFLDLPPHELANLIRGTIWRDEYFTGTPIMDIAKREGLDQSHVHRLIRRSLEIA